jgi:uncharacterized protein DUF3008
MPYSAKQKRTAGAALGAKRSGKKPPAGPIANMAKSMSEGQLEDFASGPVKKPAKKKLSFRMKKDK